MVAALLIAFREGLEAALVVGITLGYLRRVRLVRQSRYIWMGVMAAVLASVLRAAGFQLVGLELEGRSEQLFEAGTMFLAVGVLTWMIFWMRYQARPMGGALERDVQQAISKGQNWGLVAVAFVAVFREGVETALFLSAAAFAGQAAGTLIGAILGLALAASIGLLIYTSSVRLNVKLFFQVTGALLLLFAAGMLAHGVHELQETGLVPTLIEQLWDTNSILDERSPLGEALKALVGYNGNPSVEEVIAYGAYWFLALVGVRWWVERKTAQAEPILRD